MALRSHCVFLFFVAYLVSGIHCAADCKTTNKGEEYSGNLSKTVTGLTCQRWDSQHPHQHSRNTMFPGGTVSAQDNYCRNPDSEPGGPWCYTTDPEVRWEYCDIPKCMNNVVISDHLGRTCRMLTEKQRALYGYNDKTKLNTTPEDCQRLCIEEVEFECLSAEYNNLTKKCFLSHDSRDTRPESMGRHTYMTYYHKMCVYNTSDVTSQEVTGPGCSEGYIPFKQNCYKFDIHGRTWNKAFENCAEEGGHLVSIESKEEFEFLCDQIKAVLESVAAWYGYRRELWWTSGKRGAEHHTWYWVNDKTAAPAPLTWADWYPGEPNDQGGYEDYIDILYLHGKWGLNDIPGDNQLRYVCEIENQ